MNDTSNQSREAKTILRAIVTGGFAGLSPKAPGTCGTLVAFVLALFFYPRYLPIEDSLLIAILILALGLVAIRKCYELGIYGSENDDPQEIVIDEIAGYFTVLVGQQGTITNLVLAFLLFRLFDIWKPGPIRKFEAMRGEWGIMMDDVVAGFFGAIVLSALHMIGIAS